MTQFLDLYMQMSNSKLPFFGIIKLIVHDVPRGRCLDWDFCCEIVPSLSLGHYLAQHQSLSRHSPLPGGGTLDIYWWGCSAAHPKRGVLGTGTTQKRGVLGTGTTQKKGGLRHGHEWKKGVLGTGTSRKRGKKDNLSKWCCTKGGFGSLFINYPYFFLSTWSVGGGLLWQTKKYGS